MSEVSSEIKALKLYGMAQIYAELLEHGGTAAMQSSHSLIEHLLAAERTDRALRTIRYQMHIARFPVHRDLAGFDFDAAKISHATIDPLATLAFTETAHNVVMIGGTATGKTHLATALLGRLTHHCHIVGSQQRSWSTGIESDRFRHSSTAVKAKIKSREHAKKTSPAPSESTEAAEPFQAKT